MSKFRKKGSKEVPGMNTSSLPDIVFMLLFFFMVATTTKESDPTVALTQPKGSNATDMTPFKQRSEIDFLYIGVPRNKARIDEFDDGYALFLDNVEQPRPDELYSAINVGKWKEDKYKAKLSGERPVQKGIQDVWTCIKADKEAPSGILFDIREELKKVEAFSVAYAVKDNSIK